jgi:hypothetical protein
MHALRTIVAVAACAAMLMACASASYQAAALQASDSGDQKTAISLAKKEVALFSTADKCSLANRVECGTLALAYGALASYQILDRDRAGGEGSFIQAKGALSLTDPAIKASATGIVYRDVSEAFWKAGDEERAIAVFKEGRAAGGDEYLFMSSAARAADQKPAAQPAAGERDARRPNSSVRAPSAVHSDAAPSTRP